MELYNVDNPLEAFLQAKADIYHQPIGGTMELTPICNMDCKMCYVRQSSEQVAWEGGLLSVEQWMAIAESAQKAGVLYLLITGGEPFTYPGFEKLYRKLNDMGFILQINTNGTMITERFQKMLLDCPPRKLNITLYGMSDQAYGKLCGNPHGFSQVMKTFDYLSQNNIPFTINYTVTPENKNLYEQVRAVADSYHTLVTPSFYLFPPVRKGDFSSFYRMTPEETAVRMINYQMQDKHLTKEELAQMVSQKLDEPKRWPDHGFRCRAAGSGFWINWHGDLLPCGMFHEPKVSLIGTEFAEAWLELTEKAAKLPTCNACSTCELLNICDVCMAKSYTEAGCSEGRPEYQCAVTRAYAKALLSDTTF